MIGLTLGSGDANSFLESELFISDLSHMEASGKFDPKVLLWVQDFYLSKALVSGEGMTPDDLKEKAADAYRDDVGTDGFDLSAFADLAVTIYETEAVHYFDDLANINDVLTFCVANDIAIDQECLAKEAYVCLAKISSVANKLEAIGSSDIAKPILANMKTAIEEINISDEGHDLLKFVGNMSGSIEQYFDLDAEDDHEMSLWDIDPVDRGF